MDAENDKSKACWAQLSLLCRRLHAEQQMNSRKVDDRLISELRTVMNAFPHSQNAIIWQEAKAILAEFDGKLDVAILHRLKEVELMARLIESMLSHDLPIDVITFGLQDRTPSDLEIRVQIIKDLYRRIMQLRLSQH